MTKKIQLELTRDEFDCTLHLLQRERDTVKNFVSKHKDHKETAALVDACQPVLCLLTELIWKYERELEISEGLSKIFAELMAEQEKALLIEDLEGGDTA